MGRTVELRQSCFYGELYDENEKWLLSPHAFDETYHIVDLDGLPIHPAGQRGIVPAGTRFIVEKVEFPDAEALAKRMLTTPRYNPWVYLKPTPEAKDLPTDRPYFILLLPMDLEKREQVEKAIEELLTDRGTTREWLAKRRPTVRVAIEHKQILAGMSESELTAAMGKPQRYFAERVDEDRVVVAWYPSKEAWLVNGAVSEIRDAREVVVPKKEAKPTVEPAAPETSEPKSTPSEEEKAPPRL